MKFLILFVAVATALTAYSAKAEEEEKRTCRIIFPDRPKDSPKFGYIYDGKESQQVRLPTTNFSEIIALQTGEITIFVTADPITDPGNVPLNAPRLRIAKDIRDFYILVTPDRSNPILPIKMNMVNPDGKFKPGETLWFNLTEHQIAAKLGEKKMLIAPQSSTVSKSPINSSGYYRAEFIYQAQAQGSYYKITEQQWWHDAKSRHLGFIVNSGGRLPKIYFFRDFR